MMRFSERLQEHGTRRDNGTEFRIGEWLATLSASDLTLLFEAVDRVMYLDEDDVSEDEVQDVLHTAVWSYQYETRSFALLDPEAVERLAFGLGLAVWLATAGRKGMIAYDGKVSIVETTEERERLTPKGGSRAVARAWAVGKGSTCHYSVADAISRSGNRNRPCVRRRILSPDDVEIITVRKKQNLLRRHC